MLNVLGGLFLIFMLVVRCIGVDVYFNSFSDESFSVDWEVCVIVQLLASH